MARKRGSSKPVNVFTVIFGAVALILVMIAGGIALHTASFLAHSERATGTVIDMVERMSCSTDEDGHETGSCSLVWAPTVRFSTVEGREVTFTTSMASSPPTHQPGEVVQVRYRPENPSAARIESFTYLWMGPTIVAGIGLIFVLVIVIIRVVAFVGRARQAAKSDRVTYR